MTISLPATPSATAVSTGEGYRHDIDGVRTLAIVLVVVYHVWLGRVSGGVDVFLMISAFFLTASLTRRLESGKALALGAFWDRRFAGLLPAAAFTLLGVLLLVFWLYPPTRWPVVWEQTWASLFSFQNWTLAVGEVDYYARDAASTSPLQHFWSLSVQGQVFLLWPLLIAAIGFLLRRRRHRIRAALIALFSVIFVASLAFSIVETASNQAFAYFDTRTRLWEFAAGSLVALLLPYVKLGPRLRTVLSWAGIAGIVLCGVVLDVRAGFPGYLALWPVLCTAAVILSGTEPAPGSPARFLSSKPLTVFSRDAYALYLVHWPLLVTWIVLTGESSPGFFAGTAIIVLSFLLARLVSRGLERPLRRFVARGRVTARNAVVVAVCVSTVAAATGFWQLSEERRAAMLSEQLASVEGGAGGDLTRESRDTTFLPLATEIDEEWVNFGSLCTGSLLSPDPLLDGTCLQTLDAETTEKRVVVIGDSHAQQLAAPLVEVSEENDFSVVALVKGGCTIGYGEESRNVFGDSCAEWVDAALAYAKDLNAAAVYTVVTRADAQEPERLLTGVDYSLGVLRDAGIPVIAVRDNPRFSQDMYLCTLESSASCEVPRSQVLADENPALVFADEVSLIDFTPQLCPDDVCESLIGNTAVYIDENHTSRVFGRTLVEPVERALEEVGVLPTEELLPQDG